MGKDLDTTLAEAEGKLAYAREQVARLEQTVERLRQEKAAAEANEIAGCAGRGLPGEELVVLNPKFMEKAGQNWRAGKQRKGAWKMPDYYEETLWDPAVIMPALGMRPVGHIRTCFPRKNGCPRQGSIVPSSRARLDLVFGSNPQQSTEGLADFSHVWLLFLFDGNGTNYQPKPRVLPPRLNGQSKGVFATRSPHRPNPIGLSLCRLDSVQGRTLLMSGVDLVDGTPILDVKPYIPCYDAPFANGPDGADDFGVIISEACAAACPHDGEWGKVRYPGWCLPSAGGMTRLDVRISANAQQQLDALQEGKEEPRFLNSWKEVKSAIQQVLQADPRSVYRRTSCVGEEYTFYMDCLDIRCCFDVDSSVEVLNIAVVPLDAQLKSVQAGGCSEAPHTAATADDRGATS